MSRLNIKEFMGFVEEYGAIREVKARVKDRKGLVSLVEKLEESVKDKILAYITYYDDKDK